MNANNFKEYLIKMSEQQIVLMVGQRILEEIYNVSYDDIVEHQDEIDEQIYADRKGWGINNENE